VTFEADGILAITKETIEFAFFFVQNNSGGTAESRKQKAAGSLPSCARPSTSSGVSLASRPVFPGILPRPSSIAIWPDRQKMGEPNGKVESRNLEAEIKTGAG